MDMCSVSPPNHWSKAGPKLMKVLGFPGGRGNRADVLAGQVNPRLLGQPELLGVVGQPVRADLLAVDIKENVAGLRDGFGEIRLAVRLPAAEAGAAQMVRAGAVDAAARS